jgi:hypothetical protein
MINSAASPHRSVATTTTTGEQLSLLPNTQVTARFRLSRETRERGLRHVAEIRQLLADRADATARKPAGPVHALEPRRDRAA